MLKKKPARRPAAKKAKTKKPARRALMKIGTKAKTARVRHKATRRRVIGKKSR